MRYSHFCSSRSLSLSLFFSFFLISQSRSFPFSRSDGPDFDNLASQMKLLQSNREILNPNVMQLVSSCFSNCVQQGVATRGDQDLQLQLDTNTLYFSRTKGLFRICFDDKVAPKGGQYSVYG